MQQRKRKNGYSQINGRKYHATISRLAHTYALILFLCSCATTKFEKTGETFPICQLGEGRIITDSGKTYPFSMNLNHESWLLGVEVPLRGELVLKINDRGADISPLIKFIPPSSIRTALGLSKKAGHLYLSLRQNDFQLQNNYSIKAGDQEFFVQGGSGVGDFKILGVRRWWIFNLGQVALSLSF